MNFYQQKLQDMHKTVYKNQGQIDAIIAVRKYIDRHYREDLDLDLISNQRSLSKYHLIRVFKKYYGLTPGQYITDKRIAQAKELLKNGETVTSVCYAVGFSSLGSFSVLFKSRTGTSPAEYKKEQFSRSSSAS